MKLLHEDFDPIIEKGELFTLIKHDRTTTVGVLKGRVLGSGQDLLVKRFNYRGPLDFALRSLFFSRARRLWNINQRLFTRGLPVPRPVCYIRPSFRRKNSFFISSLIEDSQSLWHISKRDLAEEPEKLAVLLGKAISEWHMAGAVHGDLKWSNILLQNNAGLINIFFIDLDQARLYDKPSIAGIVKDLTRFYRAALETGQEAWVDNFFFPIYMDMMSDKIRKHLDLRSVMDTALKKWHRKGQTKYQT